MMVDQAEAQEFVQKLLRERFPKAKSMTIVPETNLIAAGIVDSFSFMDLLTEIEQKFGVSVDIGAHEFESLTTLGGLCAAVSAS